MWRAFPFDRPTVIVRFEILPIHLPHPVSNVYCCCWFCLLFFVIVWYIYICIYLATPQRSPPNNYESKNIIKHILLTPHEYLPWIYSFNMFHTKTCVLIKHMTHNLLTCVCFERFVIDPGWCTSKCMRPSIHLLWSLLATALTKCPRLMSPNQRPRSVIVPYVCVRCCCFFFFFFLSLFFFNLSFWITGLLKPMFFSYFI
jgi:hypothetical protein